jgi:hypothetical protein
MTLTGTLGRDWLRKHGGITTAIEDDLLRRWRDHLEDALRRDLDLDADFSIGTKTAFYFIQRSDTHTIVEIESFARRALDSFLDRETRR